MEQESFRLLGESANLRIGVRSVEGEGTGIEVLVRLVPPAPVFDPLAAKEMLERLETLQVRRYQLTVQEGGWVVCEKVVSKNEAASEGKLALHLFAAIMDGP